jgi:DNA-binding SARP family transcriptional activator
VEGYAATGAYQRAIETAQRALATDELAEDMHRRLIALYATIGDRSSAIRQFEHCVVVLERELGVSPLPETRAVYEAALMGELHIEQEALSNHHADERSAQFVTHTAHVQDRSPALPIPTTPLIGRAAELDQVRAQLVDPDTRLVARPSMGAI